MFAGKREQVLADLSGTQCLLIYNSHIFPCGFIEVTSGIEKLGIYLNCSDRIVQLVGDSCCQLADSSQPSGNLNLLLHLLFFLIPPLALGDVSDYNQVSRKPFVCDYACV